LEVLYTAHPLIVNADEGPTTVLAMLTESVEPPPESVPLICPYAPDPPE
jgi:hypothetical protein